MIASPFIAGIFDLLLDTDENEVLFRRQLTLLTEMDYNYTRAGLFVSFTPAPFDIDRLRVASDWVVLSGVKIESPDLERGADASVFVINGLIDYLEIFSYDGEYPRRELTAYTLTQIGDKSPGRSITFPEINESGAAQVSDSTPVP